MIDNDDADDPLDDFWLEIERDLEHELAETPHALDLDDEAHRDAVEQAMLADEERKRRPFMDDGRQQSAPTPASQERGPSEVQNTQSRPAARPRPDRSFPSDIDSRYYIRKDRNGDQHVFADSKATLEIFQESENRLRTTLNDERAVKLMLDTAAHRGWTSVTVKGTKDFRREAWLEGQARGIAVAGYKPNELDLQELERRGQVHLRNEVTPIPKRGGDGRTMDAGERKQEIDGRAPQSTDALGSLNEHTRSDHRSFDYKQGIAGVLVEKGSRSYGDNKENDPSPFVVLQDERGQQHTVWGVGIPGALLRAGAKEGDHIRLRENKMERVTKPVLREVDGKLTRVNQQVDRRAWEAHVVKVREVAREQISERANDHDDEPNRTERQAKVNATKRRVDRTVVGGERTLHVGPSRDASLEQGGYANEHRAREYLENGRAISAKNPELRGAATIEAYVERKLRAQFPNDPTAVSRGMFTARTKISQAIARGQDFPTPRVIDTREVDLAAKADRAADHPQDEVHERQREQIREIDRGL